jgi:hypothetical protein
MSSWRDKSHEAQPVQDQGTYTYGLLQPRQLKLQDDDLFTNDRTTEEAKTRANRRRVVSVVAKGQLLHQVKRWKQCAHTMYICLV